MNPDGCDHGPKHEGELMDLLMSDAIKEKDREIAALTRELDEARELLKKALPWIGTLHLISPSPSALKKRIRAHLNRASAQKGKSDDWHKMPNV